MQHIVISSVIAGLSLAATSVSYGTSVFSDDFARSDSDAVGNGWVENTVYGTGASANQQKSNAVVAGGKLVLTNDDATYIDPSIVTARYRGRTYASQDASTLAGYNSILSSNTGLVTWTFNLQQDNSTHYLSGFNYVGGGNYGAGLILGASGSDWTAANTGLTGYALLIGNTTSSNTTDPIRLVKIDGITSSTGAFATTVLGSTSTQYSTEFLSLKVTYNPATSEWAVYGESDPASFVDPTTATTSLISSVVDSTYTGTSLNYFGAVWNYANGANGVATFDNIGIDVAVPEPGTVGLALVSGLGMLIRRRSAR